MQIPTARNVILFLAFSFTWHLSASQTSRINQLRNILYRGSAPAAQLQAVVDMFPFYQDMPNDSLLVYAKIGMDLARNAGDSLKWDQCRMAFAYYYSRNEQHDSALAIAENLLDKYDKMPGLVRMKGELLALKFRILTRNFRHTEFITYALSHLSELQARNDTMGVVISMTGLGWHYIEMENYHEGLKWLYRAMEQPMLEEQRKTYNCLYSNIALAHYRLGNADSAFSYINTAIRYGRQFETLNFLANSLNFYSNMLLDAGRSADAEKAMIESLGIRQRIGEPFYTANNQILLARFYSKTRQPDKAIATCQESIAYAYKKGIISRLPQLFEVLAECYAAAGNTTGQVAAIKQYVHIKDSLYSYNTARLLTEAETKYNLQKQENLILQQRFTITRKNYIINAALAISAIILLSGVIIYLGYRKRQQLKWQQAVELQLQHEAMAVQQAREAERIRIAADLHDNLGAYGAALNANVQNLMGSTALPPVPLQKIGENVQHIVNEIGNTIWVLQKEKQELTNVFDRIKSWAMKLQENYPGFDISFSEGGQETIMLAPGHALHLYHILREGINNALKHSGGTQIHLHLQNTSHWEIHISDNGRGMPAAPSIDPTGHGLRNIKNRATACGWVVTWKSDPPAGTTLSIFCKPS